MKRTAFTIIELSVILIVIGVLISAIVVARNMVFINLGASMTASATKKSPLRNMEGLTIWFDVATNDAFPKDESVGGSSISEWKNTAPGNYDKFNVVQGTSDNRPIYVVDTKDHMPLIRFSGDDKSLRSANTILGYEIVHPEQVTVFVVQKYYSGDSRVFRLGNSLSNIFSPAARWSNGNIYWDFGNTSGGGRVYGAAPSNFDSKWNILTCVRKIIDKGVVRINGTELTYTGSDDMMDSLEVNVAYDFDIGSTVSNANIDLREIIIFKRELTSDEIDNVESYLSRKWGISLN